jgi:antitoxin component YwqK of YwqJK toxin-antitoxin module
MTIKRLSPFLLFSLIFAFCGCRTNKTINHHKEGKWVYKDSVNGILYKSKGRYNKSREIKTWKYFENHTLVKTEKYQDTICHVKTFDNKGRVTSIGKSIILEEKDGTHWYLSGDWIFFDENGKIIGIKNYQKGELISEVKI